MSVAALQPATAERADRIRPHLERAAESLFAVGDELVKAKQELAHGQLGALLAELGMAPRVAQKFMTIARNPVLRNATPGSHLPTGLTVLYELARVPDEDLARAIGAGEVTSSTTRAEAEAIRLEPAPAPEDELDDPQSAEHQHDEEDLQAADLPPGGRKISPTDIVPDPAELEDALAFADATEEQWEMALTEATAEGDLSRANVRRWLDRPVGPLTEDEERQLAKCEANIAAAGERPQWWWDLALAMELPADWVLVSNGEQRIGWLSRLARAASQVPREARHDVLLQVMPDYEPDAPEIIKAWSLTVFAGVATGLARDGWTDELLKVDLAAMVDDLDDVPT